MIRNRSFEWKSENCEVNSNVLECSLRLVVDYDNLALSLFIPSVSSAPYRRPTHYTMQLQQLHSNPHSAPSTSFANRCTRCIANPAHDTGLESVPETGEGTHRVLRDAGTTFHNKWGVMHFTLRFALFLHPTFVRHVQFQPIPGSITLSSLFFWTFRITWNMINYIFTSNFI